MEVRNAVRKLERVTALLLFAAPLVASAAFGTLLPVGDAQARTSAPQTVDGTVVLAQLPAQARSTYRLILAGGPFAGPKDGSVFGNLERILPAEPRGYYREYTVATPGARNRGARRIVCGGQPPTRPAACYYTGDHYATFRQIAP